MLGNFKDIIKCELCGNEIMASDNDTLLDYATFLDTSHLNVHDNVEKILCKYIVYKCISCDHKVKYTFKDIERAYREALTKKLLLKVARGDLATPTQVNAKFFIYCGKCQGFDGRGNCPEHIYDKCEIKRFPVNEL